MTLEEWKGANAKGIFKNSFKKDLKTVENFLPGQVLDTLVHRISRYRAKSNVVGRINVTTEVLYRWSWIYGYYWYGCHVIFVPPEEFWIECHKIFKKKLASKGQ